MRFKSNKWLLSASLLATLSGCGGYNTLDDGIEIHKDAVRKVGLTYGAQSGLAWESERINSTLQLFSRELDQIYNFNFLVMYGKVIPPILEESYLTYDMTSNKEVRMADKEIRIVRQASFVSSAPTWHDYIDISYPKPKAPPLAVLPQNKEENILWEESIGRGWEQGVQQARDNFSTALQRLNRDFLGMTTYYVLYSQNMVSAPVTTSTNLGVTGDDNAMRIGDQVLRITAFSKLNPKFYTLWNPVVTAKVDAKKPYNVSKPKKIKKKYTK